MVETKIYRDLGQQTNGAFMLGVVGPVRTGKSSFIKRFMETLVIPRIENTYTRERTVDELPQSGSGRTIMTAEPKFVPEEPVTISLDEGTEVAVRLIDSVGYMVEGAAGQFEDGQERLVTTPWFDHEVTMTEAAEMGTRKVMTEHSTIGIVVTADGSFGDIPREQFREPEERVIRELKELGKPFVVLLNSAHPDASSSQVLAQELSTKYAVQVLCVNCQTITEEGIARVLRTILEEFPLKAIGFYLPEWIDALPEDNELRANLFQSIRCAAEDCEKLRDYRQVLSSLSGDEEIACAELLQSDFGQGSVNVSVQLPRERYYRAISEETGITVKNDGDLIATLSEMSTIKVDYDRLRSALESVRENGYGVVMPDSAQMTLQEPQIVRQNGKYSVKLKANAPAIHMMMTNVETEVTPAIGGETASEDIINFLLQGFDGDVNRIWESNIFGKSLNDIAEEGLSAKIEALPDNAKRKLRDTLQRIINEGSSGLICILL